jgi:hypothetical protein
MRNPHILWSPLCLGINGRCSKKYLATVFIITSVLVSHYLISILITDENHSEPIVAPDGLITNKDSELESLYTLVERSDSDFFGGYLANVGDVQGDGRDDILIGGILARGSTTPVWAQGFNYIEGREDQRYNPGNMTFISNMTPYWYQNNERWLGDVNGDGYSDVVSISPDDMHLYGWGIYETDKIKILYGSSMGLRDKQQEQEIDITPSHGKWSPHLTLVAFGGVGDVNGDGYNDLFVACSPTIRDNQTIYEGEVQLYFGSKDGLSNKPKWNLTIGWERYENFLGLREIDFGDFNGDGYSDIITRRSWGSKYPDQYIDIYYGSNSGITGSPDKNFTIDKRWFRINVRSPVNINGDEYDDIAIEFIHHHSTYNIPWYKLKFNASCYIYNGFPGPGQIELSDEFEYEANYSGMLSICDINNDGLDDITYCNQSYYYRGKPDFVGPNELKLNLTVTFNSNGGFDDSFSWNTTIDGIYDTLGLFDSRTGDFDGDGLDDLAYTFPTPRDGGTLLIVHGSGIMERFSPLRIGSDQIMYSGLKYYDFEIYVPRRGPGYSLRSCELTLDPTAENVSVVCNDATGNPKFMESHDPNGLIEISSGPNDVKIDTINETVQIKFRVLFDWDWPHENQCGVSINLDWENDHSMSFKMTDVFSVENDLEFRGGLSVFGLWQGNLNRYDWVRGGENVTLTGPLVVYEDTSDLYPPSGICNITLYDNDGDFVKAPNEPGGITNLTIMADAQTDINEILTLTLTELPGTSILQSNMTFNLRVDGSNPYFGHSIPSEDDWSSSSRVMVAVTAEDGQTSGVIAHSMEYSYSTEGVEAYGTWTRDGLDIDVVNRSVEGLTSLDLPDGESNFVRWRIKDEVGNIGVSEDMRVRVDTHNVSFSDPVPGDDVWFHSLNIECGVTIRDEEGSGIDASTIQYRMSPRNLSQYKDWVHWDEDTHDDQQEVVTRTTVEFVHSYYNYIQWRAMDLAGNGYTTSPQYRIKIDTLPIEFYEFDPKDSRIHNDSEVTCSISVRDPANQSGVELSSIQYRTIDIDPFDIDPGGDSDEGWSEWSEVGMTGSSFDNRFSIKVLLPDGTENHIQFQGWDVAGNGPTSAGPFRIVVDTEGPLFLNITPGPDEKQGDTNTMVTVEMHDNISGLDPSRVQFRYGTHGNESLGEWTAMLVRNESGLFVGDVALAFAKGNDNVIQFRATDLVGNVGQTDVRSIWINSNPIALITHPVKGQGYPESNRILLSANGTSDLDSDELDFSWFLNGSDEPIAFGIVTYVVLAPGHYNITLVVADDMGAEDMTVVGFMVEPPPPPPRVEANDDDVLIYIILLIVIVVVLATSVYVLRNRRQ